MFTADMPGASPTIEEELKDLPDRVADALGKWRFKTADKKREAARLLLTFKAQHAGEELTMTELKAMVQNDQGYYQICLDEIMEESRYVRLYERLMCVKRSASTRAAF